MMKVIPKVRMSEFLFSPQMLLSWPGLITSGLCLTLPCSQTVSKASTDQVSFSICRMLSSCILYLSTWKCASATTAKQYYFFNYEIFVNKYQNTEKSLCLHILWIIHLKHWICLGGPSLCSRGAIQHKELQLFDPSTSWARNQPYKPSAGLVGLGPMSLVCPQSPSVHGGLQGIPKEMKLGITLQLQLPQTKKSGSWEVSKTLTRHKNKDLHFFALTAFASVKYRCKCLPQGIKDISNDQGMFVYNIFLTLIFPVWKFSRITLWINSPPSSWVAYKDL